MHLRRLGSRRIISSMRHFTAAALLLSLAAAPTYAQSTQPSATSYPALQKLLVKLKTDVEALQATLKKL